MIKSAIASKHHYYLLFYNNDPVTTESTLDLLNPKPENIERRDGINGVDLHVQLEIPERYGSEFLLEQNKVSESIYLYDLYLGSFTDLEGKKVNYFCYPYKQMDYDLKLKYFKSLFKDAKYYIPNIDIVLAYLKETNADNYTKVQKQSITVDVLKYSAHLFEGTAKAVTLIGHNPLKSRIYDIILNTAGIIMEPTSLKLGFADSDNKIDIVFDKHGNFRFWIHLDTQHSKFSLLKYVYSFFDEIKSMKEVISLSKQTKAENYD